MAIKSKIQGEDAPPFEYPIILEHGGTVVLFTSLKAGTVVGVSGMHDIRKIGEHRTDWCEPDFMRWKPLQGSVVLENDKPTKG